MDTPKNDCPGFPSTNPGEELLSGEDWMRVAMRAGLTQQEMKVAACVFQGKSRPDIARRLRCAQRTVGTYMERSFAKMNVRDRLSLVQRVMEIHLAGRDRATE
jgi:DNA-binding CsgD family transcriptional regulator